METAGVLALVYGKVSPCCCFVSNDKTETDLSPKFIEVWRQKETAVRTTQLTNILLSNASHEGEFFDCRSDVMDLKVLVLCSSHSSQSYYKVSPLATCIDRPTVGANPLDLA